MSINDRDWRQEYLGGFEPRTKQCDVASWIDPGERCPEVAKYQFFIGSGGDDGHVDVKNVCDRCAPSQLHNLTHGRQAIVVTRLPR